MQRTASRNGDAVMIRYALSAAIAAALAAPAMAQELPSKSGEQQATTLDTLVVSGTATAGGVKKLEASFSIVTLNDEQIRQVNPKNTADLLKVSPGMWPETTGGQTGANVGVAGFPSASGAPFFSTLLMGSPIYGMPTLSFYNSTSVFRLDDTIETVEILQGGPSVVFADGQIGASANYFLKTGTETPSGSVGLTWGDEGMWRLDGFAGFKIADGWYGSIGGFWRESDGVRNPEFKADKGGQLTATLAHDLADKGRLVLYARHLDDKNQFITPIPLIQHGSDSFSGYPGFDPLTGTYYSNAIRRVWLPSYPGGGKHADLADGRGAVSSIVGGKFDNALDNGWSVSDNFLYNDMDLNNNALFSGNNPATLRDMLYTAGTPGGFSLPAGSATATYVGGGAVPLDKSVIQQGWWHLVKRLRSFSNEFRLSKELFEGNTLTMGFYYAHYTMDDKWSQGNQMLMTNEPNATPITVTYVNGGQTYYRTDDQGFANFGGFHITQKGSATNKALYLSDSWRIGNWLIDLSGRVENQNAISDVCNLSSVNLDGNPATLYDNAVPVCNGSFAHNHYDKTHPAFTAGANYAFNRNMSVYARVNTGGHFADFDNGIRGTTKGNFPPMQRVRNYELGWKYQSKLAYLDVSAFHRTFTGLLYQPTDSLGAPVGDKEVYGSKSNGVNLLAALTPIKNLRLQLVANYLDGKYTDYNACFRYTDVNGNAACAPIEGRQLQRQPKVRAMFTPSYRFDMPWGDITPYVIYTYIGNHTQDQSGLQQLGSYQTLDFGVTSNVGQHWQVNLRGTNMTNEIGLTESNSRIFGSAVGTGGVLLARPLEGREVNFQVKYSWW